MTQVLSEQCELAMWIGSLIRCSHLLKTRTHDLEAGSSSYKVEQPHEGDVRFLWSAVTDLANVYVKFQYGDRSTRDLWSC